ncbi:MAG: sugar ABC transporter permease YjfF [Methylobacteriaceae bacterium]|jgi:simple sugar transport system permease protein|nr:sugar ABC transporter permease YjfF [Methylobacteriaceae bacterium]
MIRRYLPLFVTFLVLFMGYAYCISEFRAFSTMRPLVNLLRDNAHLGIAAVGMTFVIISGGIDLSVGAVIAFTTVFLAVTIQKLGVHPMVAFVLILIIGAMFGASIGAIIHYLKIPPFIATLAGMFLARGGATVISPESEPVYHELYDVVAGLSIPIGNGKLTFIAMVMLSIVVIGVALLHTSRFGSNVYALGGNATSAQLMGVPIARTTISVYVLSSVLATIAGIVFSLYMRAGNNLYCVGFELDAIAAVVIGGTLMTGGSGFVIGTFAGVCIQGLIQTYITYQNLTSWWTKIVVGFLLFAFILMQRVMVVIYKGRDA